MQFKVYSFVLSALAAIASAQSNAFNIPASGLAFTAGQTSTISWSSPAGSTVTILLRQGPSNNLNAGITIAQSIQNTGSFVWNVPSTLVQGSDYALEIIDDQNTSLINFTPQFTITSNVLSSAAVSSATATSAAPSTSATSVASSSTIKVTTTATVRTTLATVSASGGAIPTTNGTFTSTKPTGTSGASSSSAPVPIATGAAGSLAVSAGAGLAALVAGFAALY